MPYVHISRLGSELHSSTRLILKGVPDADGLGSVAVDIDGCSTCLSVDDARRLKDALAAVLAMPAGPPRDPDTYVEV